MLSSPAPHGGDRRSPGGAQLIHIILALLLPSCLSACCFWLEKLFHAERTSIPPLFTQNCQGEPPSLPPKHTARLAVLLTVWGSGQTRAAPNTGGAQRFNAPQNTVRAAPRASNGGSEPGLWARPPRSPPPHLSSVIFGKSEPGEGRSGGQLTQTWAEALSPGRVSTASQDNSEAKRAAPRSGHGSDGPVA